MNFLDKLDALMAERGITRGGLAAETGIPYNTIVGFYTKGYKNAKLSNLRRIADFFGVSLDALCNDSLALPSGDDAKEDRLMADINALSARGRRIVENLVADLAGLEAPEEEPEKITYIREYVTPAAAGYASPAEGEDYVLVPRGADVPKTADFAVRIAGDSMEPYIADGEHVYVSRMSELEAGDVGIFFVDGDMKCKQFIEDSFGNIYLRSANRARADADTDIPASSGVTVFCFGKVLLDKRIPLPKI